jgi:ankyrin repeat protein
MNDAEAVQIIIEEGADPNSCPEVFMECVAEGKLDFIRLLVRSQRGVSEVITTNAIPAAVELGNIEMVQLLVAHGADADFKEGSALKHAIEANRSDILIMLLLCANPPSETTLASMVLYVWSEPVMFSGRQGQLMELLLNGGARGNDVDAILSGAVGRALVVGMQKHIEGQSTRSITRCFIYWTETNSERTSRLTFSGPCIRQSMGRA